MRLTSPRMRVIAFEIIGQGVGGGVGENKLEGEGASASAANEAAVRGDRSADTDEELIPFTELVKRLKPTDAR